MEEINCTESVWSHAENSGPHRVRHTRSANDVKCVWAIELDTIGQHPNTAYKLRFYVQVMCCVCVCERNVYESGPCFECEWADILDRTICFPCQFGPVDILGSFYIADILLSCVYTVYPTLGPMWPRTTTRHDTNS